MIKPMRKKAFLTGLVEGLSPVYLVAILISLKLHFFILVWLAYLVFGYLGSLYGVVYLHRASIDKIWLKKLFWSNAITWLIPPIGFFTAAATSTINDKNRGADYKLFERLSIFCFFSSTATATLVAWLVF
jgi:hypothetical protein